jgi:hypothetical protein
MKENMTLIAWLNELEDRVDRIERALQDVEERLDSIEEK